MKVIIYFALALLCVNAININQQTTVAGGDATAMEDDMPDMTEEEFNAMMEDEDMQGMTDDMPDMTEEEFNAMMEDEDMQGMTVDDMGEMMGEDMPPKKGGKAKKVARKAKKVAKKAKKAALKAAKGGKTQLLLQGDAMMTGTGTGTGMGAATDMGDMTATDMGDMTATDMGEMMGGDGPEMTDEQWEAMMDMDMPPKKGGRKGDGPMTMEDMIMEDMMGPMMTGDDEMVGGEGTYPMGAPEMMTGGDGPMVGGNGTYPMGAPEMMTGGDGPMDGGNGTYPMGAPEMMTGGDGPMDGGEGTYPMGAPENGPDAGKNMTGHGDEDRDCSKVCSPKNTGMDCEASCSGCFEVPMGHCQRKECAANCDACGHCVGAVPEQMTLDEAVGEFQKMMKGGKKGGKGGKEGKGEAKK